MKKHLLRVCSFIICAVMVMTMAACGKEEKPLNVKDYLPAGNISEGIIDENEKYVLSWNNDEKCVVMADKETGTRWSTTPTEFMDLEDDAKETRLRNYFESPIMVYYREMGADGSEGEFVTARGYTHSIRKNTFSAVNNNGSITVYYLFEDMDALIPVTYSLGEECMSISIDTNTIVEGKNVLYDVYLAPFLCSVKNGTEDSYLFYPSGSGTLISASNSRAETATYTAEVYGTDVARRIKDDQTNDKNVYLPVYGIKSGDKGMCAIISSGAEQASITATVLENATKYTQIYASFALRGHDYAFKKGNLEGTDTMRYADNIVKDAHFQVDFYPLLGDEADYNYMAKLYQRYLFGDNDPADIRESVYSLKIHGGLMQQKQIFGFPYKTLQALTTYNDVVNMLSELGTTGGAPNIQMYGFGESGMDISKVAGGFTLGSAFGSKKELKSLVQYCNQNMIDAFFDFNITEFKDSGDGFTTFDSAKTANSLSAYRYYIGKEAQTLDTENYDRYRMLKRHCVTEAAQKLIKKIKGYELSGVSFSSLTDTAYSDYSSEKYESRKNMANQVTDIMNTYKSSGYSVASSGANAYAAAVSSVIFSAPLNSSKHDIFTVDVPFYQLVFKGKVEMTTEAVNAGESFYKKKLQALETGSSMLFNVFEDYSQNLTYSPYKGLYGAQYSGNSDTIKSMIETYGDYYAAISGQAIAEHSIITPDVRCTTFTNGVKVYVNYSDSDYATQDGVVKTCDCLIIK